MSSQKSGARLQGAQIFENIPKCSVEPVLGNVFFVRIRFGLDVNSILRFELMHNISLRISCMLRECL